ncbi:hypothetical protein [Chryseobacterium sp.]|uniref:hypothetical protein n=1 Tax=Chryseobacterium sp. TaxID=1871047 RepID=UPI00289C969F|nr:hypothetical protein [Chryseobacterium sp.]
MNIKELAKKFAEATAISNAPAYIVLPFVRTGKIQALIEVEKAHLTRLKFSKIVIDALIIIYKNEAEKEPHYSNGEYVLKKLREYRLEYEKNINK